ncbi:hypothetical protein DFJ58DRAFT_727663 [Suillus subalutaceus]|uniref:uncharacterized protein n=1 Tax=Suillus subalutaceus TaxID=48586 RepID=UPI001B8830F8|nr:uncharacterized protein DFJ58DRAFT_727663 [Suillus subalutaceus]KAG1854925.1 hypothetical protein DFJ58DRAFT_727663 [Suillus subalutaceus]
MKDVLRPGEEEEEWEADGEEVGGSDGGGGMVLKLNDEATAIIAELAAAHCLSSIHDPLRWLQDIGNFVQVPSVDDESLLSLVVRCRGMMGKDIRINFMIMINFMTLVCKCQSIRLKTGLHLKGIYENEVKDRPSETKVTYRTFLEWHATGSKFIAIACGGSIYALVLIAGLGLRVSIASMVGTTHLHLADMLRSPPRDSPQRKLILERIVPTIARMRLSHPFSMTSMFSRALIERFSISKDIDCTDFSASDRFFDAIIQNAFTPLRRSGHVWRACIAPVPTDLQRLPLHTVNHSELYGVGRPYSPPLSDIEEDEIAHVNKCFKPPRDKVLNTSWSAAERLRAEAGERVKSLEDLRNKLKPFYRNGYHANSTTLDLRKQGWSFMAFVSTAPSHPIRASLEVNYWLALGNADLLGDMDTRLPGGRPFPGYAPLLVQSPLYIDVQPWLLEKEGMRTNHGQVIPYISQDLQQHRLVYGTISKVYGELFEWAKAKDPPSPTSSAPPASNKGKTKASKIITDDQYDEFLKFQAQKKKEAELNHRKGLRKNVDAMLDEEESNTEHEITEHNKRKKVSKKAKPMDTDEENTPIASEDSDHSRHPEADSAIETDVAGEQSVVKKRGNGLIEVKDESQDEMAVRRRRRGANKGEVRPPTTLASLKKDGCGPLVDLAHQLLRVKIALENAFPGPSVDVQDAFAWNCIKEAGKESGSPMKVMFDRISEDDTLKGRALAYVWSGASQLRGELARKARENAKTFNKNLPFRTHLIKQLLMGQFFQGAGAEGLLYKEEFQKLPDNLIALLAASIECAYKGMLTGTPVVVEFKEPVFQPRHQYYLSKLTEYSLKTPGYMKKLRDDLWTDIGEACRFQLREEGGDSDESDVDFDAMEEYARPMSGVANVDDAVVN